MPVLSNADLLCEVRKIMDSTINEKFREFNHQFDSKIENKLENVISELQKMKINKMSTFLAEIESKDFWPVLSSAVQAHLFICA